MFSFLRHNSSQKWEHVDLLLKTKMLFKYKYISFSNLSLFVLGQFWVHHVLKNKLFWFINKNPALTVYLTKDLGCCSVFMFFNKSLSKCTLQTYEYKNIYNIIRWYFIRTSEQKSFKAVTEYIKYALTKFLLYYFIH